MLERKFNFVKGLAAGAVLIPSLLFSSCSDNKDNSDTATSADIETELAGILSPDAPSTANGNLGETSLETGDLYAVMSIRDYGDITIKLFPDIAPVAVTYFVKAANDGYYDGKNFHRIMANFMIQGGSLNGDGMSDASGVKYGVERSPNARHFYGAVAMGKNSLGENGLQFYIVNNKDKEAFNDLKEQISSVESNAQYYKEVMDEIEDYKKENGEEGLNVNKVLEYTDQYNYFSSLADYLKNAESDVIQKYGETGGVPFLDGGYTVFGQTVDGFDVIDAVSAVDVEASLSNSTEISKPVKEVIIDKVVVKTY